MKPSELDLAAALHSAYKRANECMDAVAEYRVLGVVIDRGEGSLSPFRIERGGNSGTGSISSIGWSEDLTDELTKAFHAVFEKRAAKAAEQLRELGIEL